MSHAPQPNENPDANDEAMKNVEERRGAARDQEIEEEAVEDHGPASSEGDPDADAS
jgi:hypothetical protein